MKVFSLNKLANIFANSTTFYANNDFLFANMTSSNLTNDLYLVPRVDTGKVHIIIEEELSETVFEFEGFLIKSDNAFELSFNPENYLKNESVYELTLTHPTNHDDIVYRGKLLVTDQPTQNYEITDGTE